MLLVIVLLSLLLLAEGQGDGNPFRTGEGGEGAAFAPPARGSAWSLVEDVFPATPSFFRAKLRVWLHKSDKPSLLLYHHDEERLRSREDYYSLVGNVHRRVYSSIKSEVEGKNYAIYHKQPRAPRACFIMPMENLLFHSSLVHGARLIGMASYAPSAPEGGEDDPTAKSHAHDSSHSASDAPPSPASHGDAANATHLPCQHWRLNYGQYSVDVCLNEDGHPVVIEHPAVRLEVLHYEVTREAPDTIFDPTHASKAECAPLSP